VAKAVKAANAAAAAASAAGSAAASVSPSEAMGPRGAAGQVRQRPIGPYCVWSAAAAPPSLTPHACIQPFSVHSHLAHLARERPCSCGQLLRRGAERPWLTAPPSPLPRTPASGCGPRGGQWSGHRTAQRHRHRPAAQLARPAAAGSGAASPGCLRRLVFDRARAGAAHPPTPCRRAVPCASAVPCRHFHRHANCGHANCRHFHRHANCGPALVSLTGSLTGSRLVDRLVDRLSSRRPPADAHLSLAADRASHLRQPAGRAAGDAG
jgi:hypothetical protein